MLGGKTRRLVYFDAWTDAVAGKILSGRSDIEVVRLELSGDERGNWSELNRTHGYQAVTLTEVRTGPAPGKQWLPDAAFVARCPSLLAVCSAGAGYDVVDVDACPATTRVQDQKPSPSTPWASCSRCARRSPLRTA